MTRRQVYGGEFDPKAWESLQKRAAERPGEPSPRPPSTSVTVELHPVMVALLDVTALHLGKSRGEAVAEALRCLFVSLPRPDD